MPSDPKKRRQSRQDTLYVAGLVFVGLSVGLVGYLVLMPYVANPVVDLGRDADWTCLNLGLHRIHGFGDTGRWWTGTWCGEVPFWRPLTSYVFWAMRLLWPPEYMLPRELVLLGAHFAFVAAAGVLLWKLTHRRWLTLVTLWLFAGYRPFPVPQVFPYLQSVESTLSDPKNIQEPLAGTVMLLSLIFLLNRKWKPALACAAVSVGLKETGFTTWLLVPAVLAWIHRDSVMSSGGLRRIRDTVRQNRVTIAAWLIVLAGLLWIHFHAVGIGHGFRIGKYWHYSAALYFGGPVFAEFLRHNPGPPMVALLVSCAIVSSRRLRLLPRFVGVLAALALGVLLYARMLGTTWDVSAAELLTYRLDLTIVLAGIVWLLVARESARVWRWIAFGLATAFLASVPTWVSAHALEHSRYVASLFMEIAVGAALCQTARVAAESAGISFGRPYTKRPMLRSPDSDREALSEHVLSGR